MHLAYTPEQERLRQQLREYFAGLMTPELRRGLAETGGDYGDGNRGPGEPRLDAAQLRDPAIADAAIRTVISRDWAPGQGRSAAAACAA